MGRVCCKCGNVGETIQRPGESWGRFVEPGWMYVADGHYLCPTCTERFWKAHAIREASVKKYGPHPNLDNPNAEK